MNKNESRLPDSFREIVYGDEKDVPEDIQEIRNNRIIVFYRQMIDGSQTQKELVDLMCCFMKLHKHQLDDLQEIMDMFSEKIDLLAKKKT